MERTVETGESDRTSEVAMFALDLERRVGELGITGSFDGFVINLVSAL